MEAEKKEGLLKEYIKNQQEYIIKLQNKLEKREGMYKLKASLWFFLFCVSLLVNIGFLIF